MTYLLDALLGLQRDVDVDAELLVVVVEEEADDRGLGELGVVAAEQLHLQQDGDVLPRSREQTVSHMAHDRDRGSDVDSNTLLFVRYPANKAGHVSRGTVKILLIATQST